MIMLLPDGIQTIIELAGRTAMPQISTIAWVGAGPSIQALSMWYIQVNFLSSIATINQFSM